MTSQLVLLVTTLISFITAGVRSENCRRGTSYSSYYTYCPYGCCDSNYDGCCSSNYGSSGSTVLAVGSSFGAIIFVGLIISIICCCVRRRGSHGQVVRTFPAQPMVTTTSTTSNMAVSGVSGQYPVQHGGNPWYPPPRTYGGPPPQTYGGPPPQTYGGSPPQSNGGPPPQSNGGPPHHFYGGSPPPAYGEPPLDVQPGYSQPLGLPAYSPPLTSSAPTQPQGDGYTMTQSGKDSYLHPSGQLADHPGGRSLSHYV